MPDILPKNDLEFEKKKKNHGINVLVFQDQ